MPKKRGMLNTLKGWGLEKKKKKLFGIVVSIVKSKHIMKTVV